MRIKITIILLIMTLLSSCTGKLITETRDNLLGTVITISMYDKDKKDTFEKCFEEVKKIENQMSVNIETSEISLLNKSGEAVLSPYVYTVIEKAKEYSYLTNGAFDISINPVMSRWKIGSDFIRLPKQREIDASLPLVDYENIKILSDNKVKLDKEGMSIDLGAIAKGFACDKARDILLENNVKSAILDFGGNIYALGTKPGKASWRVGVRNPNINGEGYIAIIEAADKAIVTSGGYERYFEKDGKIYHHILNTKTGYPVENNILSVTVIHNNSTDADALSTSAYALGLEKGTQLINSIDGCSAVFVTLDKKIYVPKDFHIKITNLDYTRVDY